MIRYADSVTPELIDLLYLLAQTPPLDGFLLGGGTSLALAFGHRRSVDIDFFSEAQFDSLRCFDGIKLVQPNVELVNRTPGSICGIVNGIKLDVLHHPYPWIEEAHTDRGIRFISLPDMAAMKMNAVTNRGSKKDFSDLLLLHEQGIPLSQSVDFFCRKYGESGRFLAIRSLAWFDDAETEPDPLYLNGWDWAVVRSRMSDLVKSTIR